MLNQETNILWDDIEPDNRPVFYILDDSDNGYLKINENVKSKLQFSWSKNHWKTIENGVDEIKIHHKIYLRAHRDNQASSLGISSGSFVVLNETVNVRIGGNLSTLGGDNCTDFQKLFLGHETLTEASDLTVDYETAPSCSQMFKNCTSLVNPPNLPSTTLTQYCYENMFEKCKALTKTPALISTNLAMFCYSNMFSGCESLTECMEELPAEDVPDYAYLFMFGECSSLVTAPNILGKTFGESSCDTMFSCCTNLLEPPQELNIETCSSNSFAYMFVNCSSLLKSPYIRISANKITKKTQFESCFMNCSALGEITCTGRPINVMQSPTNWVLGVTRTDGTFHTTEGTGWSTGNNGIPKGWTRVNDAVN